jgi:CelD/BcsL family acetyltransferase involved in cellulose biosynthesis
LPEELRLLQAGGPSLAARLDALRAGGEIAVEIADGSGLRGLDAAWRDLLERAECQNVFCAPAVLRAAAAAGTRVIALLAWEGEGRDRRLAGLWALAPGRNPVPWRVLRGPAMQHAYASAPVIDRRCVGKALTAMLDAIAAAPDLPNTVMLGAADAESCAALARVLAARGSEPCHFDRTRRPILRGGADPESYLHGTLSPSTRKKLRQYRRRLAERGDLQFAVARAPAEVAEAAERFLALEAQGWKGRRGTALLSRPEDAAFARGMLAALAAQGDAWVYSLALDGRPISMQVVLRAGETAFTWKTAYDESLADVSPGILLFEDYTKALLADPGIRSVDSCAHDDTGFMASWSERQELVDLMFDVRRDPPAAARVAAAVTCAYRAGRAQAKRAWHGARAKLKRLEKSPLVAAALALIAAASGGA